MLSISVYIITDISISEAFMKAIKLLILVAVCSCSGAALAQQMDTVNRKPSHRPIRKTNPPVSNPILSPTKMAPPELKRDTAAQNSDTLAQSSVVPMLKSEEKVINQQDLPKGAKDTTTLSFRDTDLRDIFRALAIQHNLNVFVDNGINKRSTVSLNKVQVFEAIKFICEQNNLRLGLEGGIFKIMPPAAPPKAELPPAKAPWVYYENNLLSVKLKNDDLESLIAEIQKKTNKNILILSGTSGSINGTLNDIEFDLGFTQLLNNNGFAVQKKNGIYVVSRLDYFVGQQSGTQGQRGGAYWISVKDSLVTIDVTNAQLDRVVADIVRQLNTDVVFYSAISGTVTARASNVPLSKAMDMILRNTNFSYRESEGIYFVGEKSNKNLLATKLIKLKYLRSDKILETIPQSITSLATIKIMKEHNGLVIIAPSDVIAQADEFFKQIDKPVAQVLIEAIVVDYDRSKGFQLGINAGFGNSGDTLGNKRSDVVIPGIDVLFSGDQIKDALSGVVNIGKLPSNFYAYLRALEQKGIANIKSRPLLATLNGTPASLSIGTTQYYLLNTTTSVPNTNQTYFQQSQNFQTIEADIKLDITPYVGSDGQITVEIKPDFKTPQGQLTSSTYPTINKRAMSSTLIMREGETIVMGGLVQETETETRSQTPILGSIPLLGYLFSSTTKGTDKKELIIYVTPHISYGEAFQNVSLPEHEE
jgi:type IV pilus assembly protein PilQ